MSLGIWPYGTGSEDGQPSTAHTSPRACCLAENPPYLLCEVILTWTGGALTKFPCDLLVLTSSNVHSILTLSSAIPGPWLELSSQTMWKSSQADAVSFHMELMIMKYTLSLWPSHRQGLGYPDDLHLGRTEHRIALVNGQPIIPLYR